MVLKLCDDSLMTKSKSAKRVFVVTEFIIERRGRRKLAFSIKNLCPRQSAVHSSSSKHAAAAPTAAVISELHLIFFLLFQVKN